MPGADSGGIDASKPNMARMYDYWLGGKDNFAADREAAEAMTRVCPGLKRMARANRSFVVSAACRAAGDGGVSQFLDLGAGLPTAGPEGTPDAFDLGDAVRTVTPSARVVYVDNDPVVALHMKALLARPPGIAAVDADLTDPDRVLGLPDVAGVLDLGRPVTVILGAVLHFLDPDRARIVINGYMDRVAAGSWLVASAFRVRDEGLFQRLAGMYAAGPVFNHGEATFESFFDNMALVEPGICEAKRWVARVGGLPSSPAFMMAGAGVRRGLEPRPRRRHPRRRHRRGRSAARCP